MNGSRSTPTRRLRLAALIVAVIGVLALAAAAFVLSYPGARDTALTAGVTKDQARIYPAIFDAVLVVACAGALSLRGVLRGYAWLAVLVITAAIAAADATHAMAVTLPKRPMEATVAVAPWAVLLIGFTLLYAMARQARPSRTPVQPAAPLPAPLSPGNGKTVPLSDLLTTKPGQIQPSVPVTPAPPKPAAAPPAKTPPAKTPPVETAPAETPPAKKVRGKKARAKAAQAETKTSEQATPAPAASTPTPRKTPAETTAAETTQAETVPAETTATSTTPPEPAPAETTAAETTPAETAPADTAMAQTEPAETSETKATLAETEPADTEPAETAPAETAPAETAPAETAPSGAPLAALPPLPRRRAIPRDEPSDADAEPADSAPLFNRFYSSPVPPSEDEA